MTLHLIYRLHHEHNTVNTETEADAINEGVQRDYWAVEKTNWRHLQ